MMAIASAIKGLRDSIAATAAGAGRDPGSVRLVIVTKTVPVEKVLEAYRDGERDFGENRVQEWQEKSPQLPEDVRWHLIGHLQTNKVKYVVGKVALIHSLDRLELADAIEKQAKSKGLTEVPCLLQVNMSGEESKFGADPREVEALVPEILTRPSVKLQGVMAIGPLTDDAAKIRDCFRKTRELREDLKRKFPHCSWEILSMGMSSDYRIAIEEGANMLRIGSLIFPRGPLT